MQKVSSTFELIYNLATVKVKRLAVEEQPVYQLQFSNEVPDVVITCKTAGPEEIIWDTVPAGNTELATGIGKLIEEHDKILAG